MDLFHCMDTDCRLTYLQICMKYSLSARNCKHGDCKDVRICSRENYVHKHIIKEHKLIASLAIYILVYLWFI
jgi:hypothetical protein